MNASNTHEEICLYLHLPKQQDNEQHFPFLNNF